MPRLTTHSETHAIKMLFIGDSGTGKTGALASLVKAGYRLIILDFDNGLDVLVNILRDEKNAEELLSRVYFATCTDKLKAIGASIVADGQPQAYSKAMKLLTNWKTEDEDLGPASTWGDDTVLVVDSLTFMGNAAYRFVDATSNYKDGRQTYGEAMGMIEDALALLYSDAIKCNVIVNSHISFIETETGVNKGYPSALGQKLSPKIPRYFNTVLQAKVIGSGVTAKRIIRTLPDGSIDLKTPTLPGKLPSELPLSTGLADFFKTMRG